jgi:DNA-binding response OmpR family regulator
MESGTVVPKRCADPQIRRKEQGRRIEAVQKFLFFGNMSGEKIKIVPIGGAEGESKIIYSDYQKDKQNSIEEVKYDNLKINLTNYELVVKGVRIDTPPKELELIYHLASNPNKVYTRDQLLDEVWGFDYYGDSRTVDVHVKRLREKLENVSEEWSLKTVWGVGYKFEVQNG